MGLATQAHRASRNVRAIPTRGSRLQRTVLCGRKPPRTEPLVHVRACVLISLSLFLIFFLFFFSFLSCFGMLEDGEMLLTQLDVRLSTRSREMC